MRVSYSEMAEFKKCRLLWDYHWRQGLERVTRTPELDRGGIIHDCLQVYYNQPVKDRDGYWLCEGFRLVFGSKVEANRKVLADKLLFDELADLEPKWGRALKEGVSLLEGYHDYWQDNFEVVLNEQRLEAELAPDVVLSFKPDLIAKIGNSLWLVEHKTGRTADITTYTIDEQNALYVGGLQLLGYDVVGTIYNFLTLDKLERYTRYRIIRPAEEVSRVLGDFLKVAADMSSASIYGNWTWTCPRCEYREVCIAQRQGYEWEDLIGRLYLLKGGSDEGGNGT